MDRRDRDRREISRRDGDSRGSEKRNSEVRGANQRSRSRSREKKREHYGRRASRSRSQDRKRDRVDKDDDKGRNNRGRKSHRSDADRDRDRDNSHKKSSHDNRTDELAKNMKEEVVENYDDSTLKEFEDFITEENVDEVQEAERLALERKLRREQILQKYNMEKTVSAPTLVALSHTSMGRSTFTVQQKITEQTQTQQNGRLNSNIDAAAVSLSTSTSNSLAALVIAESITENIRSKVDDNSAISFQELNASTVVGSILPQSVEFDGRVTKSEISRDNLDEYDREGQLGLGVGTEGTEESFELLNSVARVAVSAPTISFDLSPVTLSSSSVPSNGVHVGNNHSDNGEVERVMLEGDERLAEKNAIKQDARNHKESQPFDMFSSSPSDVERGHKGAGAGNWAGKRALRYQK